MAYIGVDDPRQGIGHIVASELGLTLPGILIAGDDSHTTTNGAMGALSLGIGLSEVTHVLATQALWQAPYKKMRVTFTGTTAFAVDAKDLVLELIHMPGEGSELSGDGRDIRLVRHPRESLGRVTSDRAEPRL